MRYELRTHRLPGYERAVEGRPVLSREQKQILFRRYDEGDEEAQTTLVH